MKFNILDHTGHTTMEFDTATKEGISEAERMFDELVRDHKNVAAVRTGPGEQALTRSFDPNQEEYLFHQPLVGG